LSPKQFHNRVSVLNAELGRRVYSASAHEAVRLVVLGQARRVDSKNIVLTQVVIRTSEMDQIPIRRMRVPQADSSTGDAGRGNTFGPRFRSVHIRTSSFV
jgi:hypothetical protein